jgi:O-antigen/teichoic acid export membrane protein
LELGKHLTKSLWGLADKALPVAYGIGYIYLVIRVLPEEEFGGFVLLQEIFLILSSLATALALQPLLKFAAEDTQDTGGIITISLVMDFLFVFLTSGVLVLLREPLSTSLNAPTLPPLLLQLPALMAASFIRNFALVLLQSRFLISRVFWVDAVHFLGAPILIWVYSRMHLFDSAMDLVFISILSLSASSLLALILTWSLFRWKLRPTLREFHRMWDYGCFSLGGVASYVVYSKADTFILSAFTGPAHVAVYTSAKIFTRIFDMVTQIIQMFILPGASLLAARGDRSSLKTVVEKSLLFSTFGMLPIMILFILVAEPLVNLVYGGRYPDAVLILQVFGLMSLAIPAFAIGSNVLMGLGEARASFSLGIQVLVVSIATYVLAIPWLGAPGAAIGVVFSSFVMAGLALELVRHYVPFTLREVLSHWRDILVFIRSRTRRILKRS